MKHTARLILFASLIASPVFAQKDSPPTPIPRPTEAINDAQILAPAHDLTPVPAGRETAPRDPVDPNPLDDMNGRPIEPYLPFGANQVRAITYKGADGKNVTRYFSVEEGDNGALKLVEVDKPGGKSIQREEFKSPNTSAADAILAKRSGQAVNNADFDWMMGELGLERMKEDTENNDAAEKQGMNMPATGGNGHPAITGVDSLKYQEVYGNNGERADLGYRDLVRPPVEGTIADVPPPVISNDVYTRDENGNYVRHTVRVGRSGGDISNYNENHTGAPVSPDQTSLNDNQSNRGRREGNPGSSTVDTRTRLKGDPVQNHPDSGEVTHGREPQ